jgi:uncharacterized membrane protein (DUF373 family)
MKDYITIQKLAVYIKFIITLILFISVKDFSKISSFSTLAVALLEFIIILELVRMLIEFIFDDSHRIKLRLMIDSTIVFFIRDIMLIVNDKFDFIKIASILGLIAVLFLFRIISMKYSPSKLEKKFIQEN